MKIRLDMICGLSWSLERLSHNQNIDWSRYQTYVPTNEDYKLAQKLCHAGVSHSKFLRCVVVWLTISAPKQWWREMNMFTFGRNHLVILGEKTSETKAVCTNFQTLYNIYQECHDHELAEWQVFCDFVRNQIPMTFLFLGEKE